MQTRNLLLLAVAAAAVSACGGGGDEGPAPAPAPQFVAGTQVLVTATTSSEAAVDFAVDSARPSDDSAEPLLLGDAALATSETDEPRAL